MRVLVTRPEPGASRTAAALVAAGHAPLVAPVMVVRTSREPLPGSTFDALVLTSANALVALEHLTRTLPVLAVGELTAAGALAAGFADVRTACGDRHALAALARETLAPGRRLLVAVGRDHKADVATLLERAGHVPVLWTAYAAEAVGVLPEEARRGLAERRLEAAMHFSRRSAAIALRLAGEAKLEATFIGLTHVCLSRDVGAPLAAAGATRIVTARNSDEASLLAALVC